MGSTLATQNIWSSNQGSGHRLWWGYVALRITKAEGMYFLTDSRRRYVRGLGFFEKTRWRRSPLEAAAMENERPRAG